MEGPWGGWANEDEQRNQGRKGKGEKDRGTPAVAWCQRVKFKNLGRWAALAPFKEHELHGVSSSASEGS